MGKRVLLFQLTLPGCMRMHPLLLYTIQMSKEKRYRVIKSSTGCKVGNTDVLKRIRI